jgi:release factor glutamine methyltransferase
MQSPFKDKFCCILWMEKCFFQGLALEVWEGVYVPAEDSFLLAENLVFQENRSFLDLGCGCGLLGILAAKNRMRVVFADKQKKALANAQYNACKANVKGFFLESDLFSGLRGKFDVVSFNPPYVFGKKGEPNLDGGRKGREPLDGFLEALPFFLSSEGTAFLLHSSLNGETRTQKKLVECGLQGNVIARKKLFFEELLVWKIYF